MKKTKHNSKYYLKWAIAFIIIQTIATIGRYVMDNEFEISTVIVIIIIINLYYYNKAKKIENEENK